MHTIKNLLLTGLLLSLLLVGNAQSTKIFNDPDEAFKSAKEFFQKEAYSLAYPIFKKLSLNESLSHSAFPRILHDEVRYYTLVCGLMLNDESAAIKTKDLIELESNSPHIELLNFYLGEYYFRKKSFGNALVYYIKTNIANLTNNQIGSMKFHKAYCYFSLQQFVEAKPLFNSIRQIPTNPDYVDANYYYGFIAFYDKQYVDALTAFKIAAADTSYQDVVPFYIAEIYYFQGERDSALTYSEAQLKKKHLYYDLQFKQLVGHLWFEKRQYAKALPYLEDYVVKTPKVRREDLYELSFCYYSSGNWTKSIEGFKQLGGKEDSLAQNCMYLLADAYLKTNQKANARNAFLFCASNNSNVKQKEVSLFSYAKLSYELDYLDIALAELKNFMVAYPTSHYIAEAKEIQVSALANTSNYKEALQLFDSLPKQSDNLKRVYPKIVYGRAVELINDQHFDDASELLTKLIQAPYHGSQLPLAYFWKGELAYRKGNLEEAISFFTTYLKNPLTSGDVTVANAKYNLAYCLLKKEKYSSALEYFEQITKNVQPTSSVIEQDAYIRSADCYFMTKSYKTALKLYESVLSQNLRNADYALFQKGIIAGAMGKNTQKILLLQSLLKEYPTSVLITETNIEIANTYMADEKYSEANPYLEKVIADNDAKGYWPQAYLKLGINYFNLNNNPKALEIFKKLVGTYTNSTESDESIEYIRNIFIADQKPDDFISFMKQNGKTISYSEEDSLTYRAAYIRYEAQDFDNAQTGLINYINKFPDGKFAINSNFIVAELLANKKDYTGALPYYKAVADKSPNKYAERCALQTARIAYFDLKDYAKSAKYFTLVKAIAIQQENKLEAMRGLLRCQYKLQDWKAAMANAQDILLEKGNATEDKMMATMVLAKNYQTDSMLDQSLTAYKQVVLMGKSELSAEAQYQVAFILYQKGNYKEAESAAFNVVKNTGSYEYWVTKSYILLGDIYFIQQDYFNAEATFKSVSQNASIEELKKIAQQKLQTVIEEKNKVNKVELP